MKKLGLTFLFLSFFVNLYSQNLRKANKLYEKKAYSEAATLFSNAQPKTQEVYEKLGDCYFFTSDMEKASESYKNLMDTYEDATSPIYYYRYSQALYGQDNYIEASKWLEKYYGNKLKNTYINNISEDYKYLKNKNSSFTIKKIPSNTSLSEFGGVFLNNKLVFASTNNKGSKYSWDKEPYLNLFIADIDNRGGLKNETLFSKEINSEKHESNAVFTKDGKTMYFTASNRDKQAKNKITHLKIYRAELVDNKWKNITDLSINDDDYSTEHPALNKDETKLYFSSDRPGSIGSFDIYVVDILKDGKLGKPKNLGNKINTGFREQFPFIHHDTLFFASTGHFGLGGLDVFRSTINKDDTFSTPRNLGTGINSPLDDFAFVINKNNSYGYLSSNREGGVGSDDIYLFKRIEKMIVNAIIKDSKTLEPLGNTSIELIKNKKGVKNFVSNSDGAFDFQIEKLPNYIYNLKVSKVLYKPLEAPLDIKNLSSNEPYVVYLEKYVEDKDIVIKNEKILIQHEPILFDLNSSYLRPEAKVILNQIVDILNKYPKIIIRCESHTDSRAADIYNLNLSKKRAKRTADYIISKGISSDRISQYGYGETQLVNRCSNNAPCSEDEHQMNRRTEFLLIGQKK
ncbi:MAG: OmpA family protein [Polaribacter sp.]